MDSNRFDRLVVALSTPDSRRGVVRLVGMLPFVGGLAMLLGDDDMSAAGRRQRHKKPHKHRKRTGNRAGKHKNKNKKQTGKPKHPDKGCKAEPIDETCAGTCGPVKNNCQKAVDCGPCDCNPPCGACEACTNDLVCESCDPCCNDVCCPQSKAACHAATGDCCAPESKSQTCNGQCGEVTNSCGLVVDCGPCTCSPACPTCQTCDTNSGECANVSNSEPCGDGLHCKHGQCVCDGASCPDGCCQGGQCHVDDDAACGSAGGTCGGCVDQGAATCGATGTCSAGQCERYASGTECQAAACMGETMLQAACTCDGQGSCDCPGPITCPNGLACRNGDCMTSCGDDDDCGSDRWCNGGTCQTTQAPGTACAAATPQQCQSGFCPAGVCLGRQCPSNSVTCDCSNLNHCNGNGCCTETCSCLCDEGWSGAACTDEPPRRCDAYPTCGECQAHISDGCTWCSGTVDGAVDVCTTVDVCLAPVEMCVCDSTSCPNGCCDAQGQCQVNAADVCGSGGGACVTCNQCGDFCDEGICQGGSCDCAALDGCSGHGCCTDTCGCVCVAPWTGADCSELPPAVCADFETCEECSAHTTDLGCVRCSDTFDGEFTACVAAIECLFAVESCQ